MQTIWDQFELDWWDDPISNMTVSLLTNYGDDGIMSAMASEITGVVIVFTTVGSGAYEKHQGSASLWGEFTVGQWIPRTKGQ